MAHWWERRQLTYKPNKDYVGQDSFTFKAIDEKGSESNIATVTIDVKAVDQAPATNTQMDQGEEEDVISNLNESNSTQTGLTSPNKDNEDQGSNLQQRKYPGILKSDQDYFTSLKEFELTNPKLGALLTQKNPKTTHKLIIESYANSGLTIDAPPSFPYPKRPSIILQTGSLISVVSANPDITFKSTKLTLYDKSDLPFNPTPNETNSWSLDVPPGLYKLKVKTEYSPDNSHTVSFIDTIRVTKGKDLDLKEYINKKLSHIDGQRDTN